MRNPPRGDFLVHRTRVEPSTSHPLCPMDFRGRLPPKEKPHSEMFGQE